jgi:hypothetical protein
MIVAIAVMLGALIAIPLVVVMRRRAKSAATARHDEIQAHLEGSFTAGERIELIVASHVTTTWGARRVFVVVTSARVLVLRAKSLATLHEGRREDVSEAPSTNTAATAARRNGLRAADRYITIVIGGSKRSAFTLDTIWTAQDDEAALRRVLANHSDAQ